VSKQKDQQPDKTDNSENPNEPEKKDERYDEDQLVEWIACGQLSQSEMARRLGVNRRTVWRIANGLSRPDLQRKIDAVVEGIRHEAGRQGARWLKSLVAKHIRVGLEEDGETARKCREYVLDRFLVPDDVPTRRSRAPRHKRNPPGRIPSFTDGISDDLKTMLIDELGGPPSEKGAGDCRLSTGECKTPSEDTKTDKPETKTEKSDSKPERQNDSESGDKSPHSKETAPPPSDDDKEQTKVPEQEPEQDQKPKKPKRAQDPIVAEMKRQAERERKLQEERDEERRNRPIPIILQSGDHWHRAPHLYDKNGKLKKDPYLRYRGLY